jgi:hypothetical protein
MPKTRRATRQQRGKGFKNTMRSFGTKVKGAFGTARNKIRNTFRRKNNFEYALNYVKKAEANYKNASNKFNKASENIAVREGAVMGALNRSIGTWANPSSSLGYSNIEYPVPASSKARYNEQHPGNPINDMSQEEQSLFLQKYDMAQLNRANAAKSNSGLSPALAARLNALRGY